MINLKAAKRIIIKVGTSSITYPNGKLNLHHLEALCKVISDLQNSGKEMVLVTSGAIGVGVGKLGLTERPEETSKKQALAAIGQCELMFMYDKFFGEYNQTVAQILLTPDVINEEKSKTNVQNTFDELISMGVIPIVNENDTVATDELEGHHFGDNDTLSALVATLIDSDCLVILTDIDGLYDQDPKKNPNANRIPLVEDINHEIIELAGGAGSQLGTGGMATKIKAAQISTKANIPCSIINGSNPSNIYDLFDGKDIGTTFK